jgi:heparanase 1
MARAGFVCLFLLCISSSGAVRLASGVRGSFDVLVNGGAPWRRIRSGDRFVCVTLDWWPGDKYSSNPGAHYPWANASILNLDLADPTLTAALEALAPVRLRVGGSLADQIYYSNMDGSDNDDPSACTEPVANTSIILGYGPGCLAASRFDDLLELCARTGAELVFGLNGLYGRTPAPDTPALWAGPWDPANAEALLRHVRAFCGDDESAGPLVAVELGNEIDGAAGIAAKLPPATYASDFVVLRTLLKDIWPGNGPMLVGPDSSGFSDSWWYPQFLSNVSALSESGSASATLDAVTWHLYLLGSGNSSAVPDEILNSTVLNSLSTKCQLHHSTLASFAGDGEPPQFWLGEGGGAYGSGQDGSTNTFRSTFWFADSLGTLAAQGHDSFCRQVGWESSHRYVASWNCVTSFLNWWQTLVGGNYALLEPQENGSLWPNPDFYISVCTQD